ncbi:MAG: HD-GYP domain-containing protein [Christensenellales bacterium]
MELGKTQLDFIKKNLELLYLHSKRDYTQSYYVGEICAKMAKLLHLTLEETNALQIAATVHNFGKLKIDKKLLQNENLTANEKKEMKKHVEYTLKMIKPYFSKQVYSIVEKHHERLDGSGYPNKLKGEELSLLDRVFHVCDVTSTLMLPNNSKCALTKHEIADYLITCVEKSELDEEITQLLIEEYIASCDKIPNKKNHDNLTK